MRFRPASLRCLALLLGGAWASVARAEPVDFNLRPQTAARALLDFSRQAKIEVLFPFDELRQVHSAGVVGRFEPAEALDRLLRGTGFAARQNGNGKFVVTAVARPTGSVKGRLVAPDGTVLAGVRVEIPVARQAVVTDAHGGFDFASVPPGGYTAVALGAGLYSQALPAVRVAANTVHDLGTITLQPAADPARLDPFVVESPRDRSTDFDRSQVPLPPRAATGNLDLPRTQTDALTYTILDRTRLAHSGVVNLNDFLRRELLDSNATALPPEQDSAQPLFFAGSSNLALRGFSQADETIIMVNGRRLPELITSGGDSFGAPRMPDVNFIPVSLVQEVEVLPVSAASLYNGNPVGGVINIVLRPAADMNLTEVSTTYTNALHRYDAAQSSVSFTHMQTLLGGALRVSLNASFTRSVPPTESELRYHQKHDRAPPFLFPIYRATPNVRSPDGSPLAALGGDSPFTSVAPGADGSGGLAAFAGRAGARNLAFFKSPGGFATSADSVDFTYGRRQQRDAFFGSVVYDVTPWLQLGLDGTLARTHVNRGYDVLPGDLELAAGSPFNPFGQDVMVSLNETAPKLGRDYSQARLEFASAVFGALLKLPREWRASADAQFAHNLTKYRGLAGVDRDRWQQLVDAGQYNPLRDTQVFAPPPAFYDQVLVFRGGPNRFATLGDYGALDLAARLTNEALKLPTGAGAVNVGGDFRSTYLAKYHETLRHADGSLAAEPADFSGRTLQRYSAFAEVRAPLVGEAHLPGPLRRLEGDLAVRYVAANSGRESYVAPTFALKAGLRGGLAFRGSITTSNRYPTPQMSRRVFEPTGDAPSLYYEKIIDRRRNGEAYPAVVNQDPDPVLFPESAVTQTAGLIFQRGRTHRLRATLDFVDTRKTNEMVFLDSQTLVDLEPYFPGRVQRAPLAPGDPHAAGAITSIMTGTTNLAWRHSQDWNATLDYSWSECFGGTLDAYGRLLYFQTYRLARLPGSPPVNELRHPDGSLDLLKYRANFGASWSNRRETFGFDGHYFHSRLLPDWVWASQGRRTIMPYWQFDGYVQTDLGRRLPWRREHGGLTLQLRVNNLFRWGFPFYVDDPTGVQPYGDWRGRTYSLSLTATF